MFFFVIIIPLQFCKSLPVNASHFLCRQDCSFKYLQCPPSHLSTLRSCRSTFSAAIDSALSARCCLRWDLGRGMNVCVSSICVSRSQGFKTVTGCFMTENYHNLSLFLTGSVQLEQDSFSLPRHTNSPHPQCCGWAVRLIHTNVTGCFIEGNL